MFWIFVRIALALDIDHEILSMVIVSLPLIQDGQLSVSGERMYCETCVREPPWRLTLNSV